MGILEQIREEIRAAEAATYTSFGRDDRYWKDLGYAFQLHGPAPGQVELFTLVLAPTRYDKRLPNAAEIRPSQDGGTMSEEHGFVLGELTIEGHTGVSPRSVPEIPVPLSGQAHFKRLQDHCYLKYCELKADPLTTNKVFLTFHSFKDDEHFVVVPRTFGLKRTADKRPFYPYEFQLAIVGDAKSYVPKAAEDDPVLAAVREAVTTIAAAVGEMHAFLIETVPYFDQIEGAYARVESVGEVAQSGVGVLREIPGSIERIAGRASEFVRGASKLVKLPYEQVLATMQSLDSVIRVMDEAADLPKETVQSFRRLVDALEALATYPEKFRKSFSDAAEDFLALAAGPSALPQGEIDAAEASTVTQAAQLAGTGPAPGDAERIRAGAYVQRRTFPRYQGFREYVVMVDDLLATIAAREMGDARRWIDIALANDLRAPYISSSGFPDTVGPGDTILIPTLRSNAEIENVRSSGNSALGASQYDEMLGRDWMLIPHENGWQVTWALEAAGGNVDLSTVAGMPNMEQAIETILNTVRGTCPMFMQLGYVDVVGKAGTLDRVFEAQLRITEALLRDPRIENVRVPRFHAEKDTVSAEVETTLKNSMQLRTLARSLS